MNGNKLAWIFAVLSAVLLVVSVILLAGQDRTAPQLSFTDTDIIYSQDMDKELLYQGATASDNRDGDITDRIVIEKIVQAADGGSVSVTYAVNDTANNFTKQVRVFERVQDAVETMSTGTVPDAAPVQTTAGAEATGTDAAGGLAAAADAGGMLPGGETPTNGETADATGTEITEADPPEAEQTAAEQTATDEETPPVREAQNPAVSPEAPVLELADAEVTTRVGVRPAWVNVIKTLTDDKDDYNTLYRNLILDGTYSDGKPGDYDVTLRTVDSQGNKSAVCSLKIHVLQ